MAVVQRPVCLTIASLLALISSSTDRQTFLSVPTDRPRSLKCFQAIPPRPCLPLRSPRLDFVHPAADPECALAGPLYQRHDADARDKLDVFVGKRDVVERRSFDVRAGVSKPDRLVSANLRP